jgi:hypothetical protein
VPRLLPQGRPDAKVWIVVETPFPQDKDKGYLWSGGYGYVFQKMMQNAGIRDYYVIARAPDTDDKFQMSIIENELNHYQPPIVIAIENSGKHFCKELIKSEFSNRKVADDESEISKYNGSLLRSPLLTYPHWIIPTYGPDTVIKDWKIRDIVTSLDLGKAASELEYWENHNHVLEPYLERTLKYEIKDFTELLGYLDGFKRVELLSNDIETVYPKVNQKRPSAYEGHPGLHVSCSFASSSTFGVAFELFREDAAETRLLWRTIQEIFDTVPQLGQNFFSFDCSRWEMLGFRIDKFKIQDTLIRQHILFPELPKDLAFMTRQYTREPYYKDEGHGWNMKDMRRLRRYNALDTTVTFEVFLAQEKEFDERPHLR